MKQYMATAMKGMQFQRQHAKPQPRRPNLWRHEHLGNSQGRKLATSLKKNHEKERTTEVIITYERAGEPQGRAQCFPITKQKWWECQEIVCEQQTHNTSGTARTKAGRVWKFKQRNFQRQQKTSLHTLFINVQKKNLLIRYFL